MISVGPPWTTTSSRNDWMLVDWAKRNFTSLGHASERSGKHRIQMFLHTERHEMHVYFENSFLEKFSVLVYKSWRL